MEYVVLQIATGTDCSDAFLACCRIPYKRFPSLVLSNAGRGLSGFVGEQFELVPVSLPEVPSSHWFA